jgi:acetylornithine/succinyldiaminopimelate/putrescine aminotransferase
MLAGRITMSNPSTTGRNTEVSTDDLRQCLTTNTLPAAVHPIVHAEGVTLTDQNGKDYIDLSATTLNMSLGHGFPSVLKAAKHQMDKVCFIPTYFQNPAYFEACSLLIQHAPKGLSVVNMRQCNGADAVETACKMALLHTRRREILCIRNAWHGGSLGALTLSSRHTYHRISFFPSMCYSNEPTLKSLGELVEEHPRAAAVVIDPVGVSNGVFAPECIQSDLKHLRELCTQHGIMLIFDEIQTFGFMGATLFAATYFEVTPDIVCVGKALGCGFPLSATICRDELRAVIMKKEGEYTFGGQPLACTAAVQVINAYMSLSDEISHTLASFEGSVQKLKAKFPGLCFHQVGFMLGITRKDKTFTRGWVNRVYELSVEQGFLVQNNLHRSVIIKPPVIIKPDVLQNALESFGRILTICERELEVPSMLYVDAIKFEVKLTTLSRIKKKQPVPDQWQYVGALLALISPTLSVEKIEANDQKLLSQKLENAAIPVAEMVTTLEGQPEYLYIPGISMDFYMNDHCASDPGMVNGLVLEHQRYVEMAHDAGFSIPDRWPGNAIVNGTSLVLIDFDLIYLDSTGTTTTLFAFEEVFSTFQCVSWVRGNDHLQQNLADRLCYAVLQRQGPLTLSIWEHMIKFYSNPDKPFLPESLGHIDYIKGIEAISRGFAKHSNN